MTVKEYHAKEELISIGHYSDQMFFIIKGIVCVELDLKYAGLMIIEKLHSRTIINLHNIFLTAFRSSCSYVCETKCEVLMITHEKLLTLCHQHP